MSSSSSKMGIFSKALNLFRRADSSKPAAAAAVKLIGEDHLGNKYFEAKKPEHQWRPVQRYFEKPEVKSFDQLVDAAHVPPAWDAWLRFRRQDAPTKEEVDDGEEYYRMQQDMAERKRLEADAEAEDLQKANDLRPGASLRKTPKSRSVPPNQYKTF